MAVAIEHGAEELEGAGNVEVGDVDMPVFGGFERLHEARSLLGWCPLVAVEEACALEHPVDARWADGDAILIEHHERKSPITFEWESAVEVDDRLLFPGFEPAIPWDVAVVGMGSAVVFSPAIALAGLEPVLVAQVRDGGAVDEVPPDDGELLRAGEPLALLDWLAHGMESSEGKGRLTPHREHSSFDGSKTIECMARLNLRCLVQILMVEEVANG